MGPLSSTRNSVRQKKRKLYLFCDHALAREQFSHMLKRSDFELAPACDPAALPMTHTPSEQPGAHDVAVIDGRDVKSTLQLARDLHIRDSDVSVLVLLPELTDSLTYPLLRFGVKGLLSYHLASRELCRAAAQLATGGYWVPRDLLTRFVESILPELSGCKSLELEAEISRRERDVLDLLLDNLSNKEIAGKLFVSERTVKFHVSNLLSKFHVQRRADLIVLWMQQTAARPWLESAVRATVPAHVN